VKKRRGHVRLTEMIELGLILRAAHRLVVAQDSRMR
jgi:hypothetical protein